ncbi:MAG: AFG1/ZapE family ATPase [Methyloceanibacter sp.]
MPQTALGVARFSFADLCEAPLGSVDYQRIAHTLPHAMVDEIPVLGPEQRNKARRLITLIDVLYENGVGLIASAEAEPRGALPGRRRRRELRPHRLAVHGDALRGLS